MTRAVAARRGAASLAAALWWAANAGPAAAQEVQRFELNQLEVTPPGDRFFGVPSAAVEGSTVLRAGIVANYAHNPLVLRTPSQGDELGAVVTGQMLLHVGASLAIADRALVSIDEPFALAQGGGSPEVAPGETIESPSSAAAGDLRLGARVFLVEAGGSAAQLALGGYLWVPIGSEAQMAGDGSLRGEPHLILGGRYKRLVYSLKAGALIRELHAFGDVSGIGTAVSYGGAAGLTAFGDRIQVGPELYGTTGLVKGDGPDARTNTNLEVLLGGKLRLGSFVGGAGVGFGLTRGIGTPDMRLAALLSYAPKAEPGD